MPVGGKMEIDVSVKWAMLTNGATYNLVVVNIGCTAMKHLRECILEANNAE